MDAPGQMQDITIETVSQIVKSVQLVVAKYYGPQCLQTLLTSQTGQAVITSDGLTILDTLQPSHPIAVIVANTIRNCLKVTQDGCKVFLLYLSSILDNTVYHILKGEFSHSGTNTSANRQICMRQGSLVAVRVLQTFQQNVLPDILDKIYIHCSCLYTELRETKSSSGILEDVCKTTMAAHFYPKQCEYFSDLLTRFIGAKVCPNEGNKSLGEHDKVLSAFEFQRHLEPYCAEPMKFIRFVIDNFRLLCIKVPNRPYTESLIMPSILINRDFTVECEDTLNSKHLNILLLRSSISGNEEDGVSLSIRNNTSLTETIKKRRSVAEAFVNRCSAAHVGLILCTESMPGYMLDMFRRQNISVVTYVQTEDIEFIEQLTSKLSHDFYYPITEQSIFTTECIKRVGLGGRVYLHIQLQQGGVNQLILCAPTQGLCDQTASVFQKALTCMMLSLCHVRAEDLDTELGLEINAADTANISEFPNQSGIKSVDREGEDIGTEVDDFVEETDEFKSKVNDIIEKTIELNTEVNDIFEESEEFNTAVTAVLNSTVSSTLSKSQKFPKSKKSESKHGNNANQSKDSLDVAGIDTERTKGITNVNNAHERTSVTKNPESDNDEIVNYELSVIEGGGGFEILLAHLLQEYNKDSNDKDKLNMCKILSDSLLNVVRTLYDNVAASSSDRGFLDIQQELQDGLKKGSLWGLSRRGKPCDVKARGVLEPLLCKVHIFTCVINLMQQLLQIDGVVGVRKME